MIGVIRWTFALLVVAPASTTGAFADWPTEGGNDGKVIEVTTLADDGAGSLRAALATGGGRRIVFSVGGEIFLRKPLAIRTPFVTIDGETAPSPGISLLGDKLQIKTHDVIVRHLRIRVGELPGSEPSNRDGISIDPGSRGARVGNILIDHCSVAWAVDENIGVWGEGAGDILIRRTIIAEALANSIHPKGRHSMGMLIGKGARNVVVEANLFAHNIYRNPLIDAGATAIVVNNLIYDPGWNGFHVYAKAETGPTIVSVVGNVLIAGPGSKPSFNSFSMGVNSGSEIYYEDNQAIGAKAFSLTERGGEGLFVTQPPIWFDWIEPIPSSDVEADILANVGARPTDRDETDRRIIAEVQSRSGSIKDAPTDERLLPRPPPQNASAGQ